MPETTRELEARVAARVMGWRVFERDGTDEQWQEIWGALNDGRVLVAYDDGLHVGGSPWQWEDGEMQRWSPLSDPADDYAVLERVRERAREGDEAMLARFVDALYDEWYGRTRLSDGYTHFFAAEYRVGDYARAALAALEGVCADCGHAEGDHDGYGGVCDGDMDPETGTVCGCAEFRASRR